MVELRDATLQQLRDWQAIQLSYRPPKELDALMQIPDLSRENKAVVRLARRLRRERLRDIDISTDRPVESEGR